MDNKNFAIFASGSGTNAEVLVKHAFAKNYPLKMIFTDKKNAGVIKRLEKLDIPLICIEKESMSKDEYEQKILKVLDNHGINWIFLAGYMKILGQTFLDYFFDQKLSLYRIINIHPSLLPSFPGADGFGDAFSYGVKISGITIHFVDKGVDTGPILLQETFRRDENDTLESFKKKGQMVEHKIYPKAIDLVMNNNVNLFRGDK